MSFSGMATSPPVRPPPQPASVVAPSAPTTVPSSAAGTAAGSAVVTQISPASQLLCKLGQLAEADPTKFKAVTGAIASQLAARASTQKQELAKRATLEAELSHAQKAELAAQGSATPPGAAATPASGPATPTESLVAAFTAASSGSNLGTGASAVAWTESGLAGALAGALALVNEALGL